MKSNLFWIGDIEKIKIYSNKSDKRIYELQNNDTLILSIHGTVIDKLNFTIDQINIFDGANVNLLCQLLLFLWYHDEIKSFMMDDSYVEDLYLLLKWKFFMYWMKDSVKIKITRDNISKYKKEGYLIYMENFNLIDEDIYVVHNISRFYTEVHPYIDDRSILRTYFGLINQNWPEII